MGAFSSLISKVASLIDEELILVDFLTDKQYKAYTSETRETKKQLSNIRTLRKKLIHDTWTCYNYPKKIFILQHLTYSFDSRLDNLKIPLALECLDDENNTIQSLGSHLLFLFFCRIVYKKFQACYELQDILGPHDFEFTRDFACLWGYYEFVECKTSWEEIVDNYFKNELINTIVQYIWDVVAFITDKKDILSDSSIDCLIDFVFEGSLKHVLKGFSNDYLEDLAIVNYERFSENNSRFVALCCDILIQRMAFEDFNRHSRMNRQDLKISLILSKLCFNQESDIQTDWQEYKNRVEVRDDQLFNNDYCLWYEKMYLIPKLLDIMNCDELFEEVDNLSGDEVDLESTSLRFDNMNKISNTRKSEMEDEEEILQYLYDDESYFDRILDDSERFENGLLEDDPESWDL